MTTPASHLGATLRHTYHVECWRQGQKIWEEDFHNLVTTVGLNKYLDATLKTGLAAPAWYVGLVKASTTGYAAGDTLASHGGWTEATPASDYDENRVAFVPGAVAAGSVDNSASKAAFTIADTLTIKGALLCDAETGTDGVLLGVGDFTGGDRSVVEDDTLNVTVTCSIANPA